MSLPELKLCPFCGGPAELKYTPGSYGYYSGKFGCRCPKCNVATKSFDDEEWSPGKGHVNVAEKAKVAAIEVWNTRAHEENNEQA